MSFFNGLREELLKIAGFNPECGTPAVEILPERNSPLVHEWHQPADVESKNSIQDEYHQHRMPDGGKMISKGRFDAKRR